MSEPLESLYQQIGHTVSSLIDANWEEIKINVEVKPGVIQLKCSYLLKDSEKVISFTPNRMLVDHFEDLHERMAVELQDDWKIADFTLTFDGKFEIQFGY